MVGAVMHLADVQDCGGALMLLRLIRKSWPWLRHVLVPLGDWQIKIIKRCGTTRGFVVLLRRRGAIQQSRPGHRSSIYLCAAGAPRASG
ncbi:MAG: hypothetical protein ACJAVR_004195 [Paracoccaceae bacterium]|jgi:hypothetical protein